ncbi:HK97 family phage prohead protease [Sorangium sp. So ce834]|uniref:HK97 family phage prohead protease n=1 Tax=Sorangium sp. So ce834 TaxID=3133321 RepID=UPI003F5EE05F
MKKRTRPAAAPLVRSAQVRSIDEERRRISAVASTEAVDSYSTILRANWELARFNANPVLLFAHNDCMLPVGTCENVRVEGKALLFDAVFDDATEFDQQVWEKYRRGVLRGFSVRFNPLERRVIEDGGRQVIEYTRSELMEISCVPVPANPEALRRSAGEKGDAMKKGALMKALRAIMDGDGSDDEKKAAAELYEKMGGDDAMKAAEGEDDEGRAEGDEGDKKSEEDGEKKGDEDGDRSARAPAPPRPAARPPQVRSSGGEVIDLAVRVAQLEASEQRRAVASLVEKHKDRFTETTRAWALGESLEVVQRYIKRAPKVDLKAPAAAPAVRGAEQGTGDAAAAIPGEDEKRLDRMFGIQEETDQIGYGQFDPIRGVRVFQAPSPGKVRAAAKGVK